MQTFHWKHTFSCDDVSLWPLISDLQHIEEVAGMPPVVFEDRPSLDGGSTLFGSTKQFGLQLEWEEKPFEWVANREYRIERIYSKGPLKYIISWVKLSCEEGRCILSQRMEVQAKNPFWSLVARVLVGFKIRRAFLKTYAKIDKHICSSDYQENAPIPIRNSTADPYQLKLIGRNLIREVDTDLVQLLTSHLATAGDRELYRMRPRALARSWQADPEETTHLFLHATRHGLVKLTWDLLCPQCRRAPVRADVLSDVARIVHCEACNIDYKSDLAKNVEAVFSPGEGIRSIQVADFCTAGPQTTPHILLQKNIPAMDEWSSVIELAEGSYLLRGVKFSGQYSLTVDDNGADLVNIVPTDNNTHLRVKPQSRWAFRNPSESDQIFILEEQSWKEESLTASQVLTMGAFRGFFSDQIIRPDMELAVSHLWFLFADVIDSVGLYEDKGDAASYAIIQEHFRLMETSINKHRGSVVKTVGDAVMATFTNRSDAVRAIVDYTIRQESSGAKEAELHNRFGLFGGPCIAISNQDQLDYFGRSVNMAARLVTLGGAGEIVMEHSQTVPLDAALLFEELGLSIETGEMQLKGFAAKTKIARIQAKPSQAKPSQAKPSQQLNHAHQGLKTARWIP